MTDADARRARLGELAALFLRLGTTAFGGPAAHLALLQRELVERRGWMSRERYLELIAAANLIPGPNSTEVAIHIGAERAGWRGLIVAGVCFILPAALLSGTLAALYVHGGALPQVRALLAGVAPVMLALIVHALLGLGRTTLGSWDRAALAAAALGALALGVHELLVLFVAGGAGLALAAARRGATPLGAVVVGPGGVAALATTTGASASVAAAAALGGAASPGTILVLFAKIGSVLFGSGYVLLAFLRAELVERLGWLSEAQLFDAITVGQITPGPVFSTATFVGGVLAGPAGALAATVGIFLPAFVFVALSRPILARLGGSALAKGFLGGAGAASLALMAAVAWPLGHAALSSWAGAAIGAVALALFTLRPRWSPTWPIVGGAIVGAMFLG